MIREDLINFEPYAWEPSTEEIARAHGLRTDQVVRMDTNVSPFRPVSVMKRVAIEVAKMSVNQYPDTSYRELREAMAEYVGWDANCIVPTNGADEAIDIVARTYLTCGRNAVSPVPTYSYFRIATELQGARFKGVGRRSDFYEDVESILTTCDGRTSVIWLCDPNNPTGNGLGDGTVERLCEETDALVVVDEAYHEFSGRTATRILNDHENLCVIRTLSKAFGLAGMRIGFLIANETVVRQLNKARPPNSIGTVNARCGTIALRNHAYVMRNVERLVQERERIRSELSRLKGVHVYPSSANFLLIKFLNYDVKGVKRSLLQQGMVVRSFEGNPYLSDCLRVTVCSKTDNDRFLKALSRALTTSSTT
ncbi:MAG: histidinol-phosphate transaminase [Thaumarchaeota archaeon]|nr:histidinol-phosphate transaminase [Candidatus Calditenuaceae archaeon]MDW8186855.1 histidinol-phosphate transaminase [Nitrososphaerota archaeon]